MDDGPDDVTAAHKYIDETQVRRQRKHNFTAMFLAFSRGAQLEDIANTFGIEPKALAKVAADQDWVGLADKARKTMGLEKRPRTDLARAEELVNKNREANLKMFERLREELVTNIQKMAEGKLTVEQLFSTKAGVISSKRSPNMQDRQAIAAAAKIIAEGTYRALGDFTPTADSQNKKGPGEGASVTLILPGVVLGDRNALPDQQTEIIDLRPAPQLNVVDVDSEPTLEDRPGGPA